MRGVCTVTWASRDGNVLNESDEATTSWGPPLHVFYILFFRLLSILIRCLFRVSALLSWEKYFSVCVLNSCAADLERLELVESSVWKLVNRETVFLRHLNPLGLHIETANITQIVKRARNWGRKKASRREIKAAEKVFAQTFALGSKVIIIIIKTCLLCAPHKVLLLKCFWCAGAWSKRWCFMITIIDTTSSN